MDGSPLGARGTGAMAWGVLARPGLWPTALRQVRRLARPGWWRRPPFLPVPDADYLAFRLETQYGGDGRDGGYGGSGGARARGRDLCSYLEWCRDQDRRIRGRTPRDRR